MTKVSPEQSAPSLPIPAGGGSYLRAADGGLTRADTVPVEPAVETPVQSPAKGDHDAA